MLGQIELEQVLTGDHPLHHRVFARLSLPTQQLDDCRRHIARRGETCTFAINRPKDPIDAIAEAGGVFQHGIEHRREIARRGIDDLQYLGGRGLLVARFFEFGAAGVELSPQLGIGSFELGHPVVDRRNHPITASR